MTGAAFSGSGGDHHWRWGYNDRSELTAADRCSGTDLQTACSPMTPDTYYYAYDPIGNREQAGKNAASTYYCANELNQYEYTGTTQITCPPQTPTLTYDADGNLTGDGQFTYTWDAENRLIGVEPASSPVNGDKKLAFKYDYMNRRVEKTVWTYNSGWGSPTQVLRFIYDRWNVVLVLDGLDDNAVLTKYTWGLDLSGQRGNPTAAGIHGAGGIGGLLAVEETAESGSPEYWFLHDANGNVGQIVQNTTNYPLTGHYEYDAYGNAIVVADLDSSEYVDANAFRFSTKWFETESSLGYWGYRYYFPGTGRWLSRDPVQELGGLNIYGYAYNDVTNKIDYLGQVVPAIPLIALGAKTYMTGSACSNAIQALYCCYLFYDCKTNAVIAAQAAMKLWDAQVEKEDDPGKLSDIYAKAMAQINAANFGSECSELGTCCLKKGVKAIAWATSRYFVFKIEWIKK